MVAVDEGKGNLDAVKENLKIKMIFSREVELLLVE